MERNPLALPDTGHFFKIVYAPAHLIPAYFVPSGVSNLLLSLSKKIMLTSIPSRFSTEEMFLRPIEINSAVTLIKATRIVQYQAKIKIMPIARIAKSEIAAPIFNDTGR